MTTADYPMVTMNSQQALPLRNGQRVVSLRARREAEKQQRVMDELRAARVGWYGMLQPEPRWVAGLIHDWEHVAGAVYGYSPEGFALLTTTNLRVLFVSKKFVFTQVDEVSFESVTGVSLETVGPYGKLTLHAENGDHTINTINIPSARRFVAYIELKLMERERMRHGARI